MLKILKKVLHVTDKHQGKIFNLKMLMKNLKINEEKQGDFYKRQKSQCSKILHNST